MRQTSRPGTKVGYSDPAVPHGRAVAQRIKLVPAKVGLSQASIEIVELVEIRIGDLGGEIPRFPVQLRMILRRRYRETPARGKRVSGEGNNPDGG